MMMSALKHSLSADMLYPKSAGQGALEGGAGAGGRRTGGRSPPHTQALRLQQHAKQQHYAQISKLAKQPGNWSQSNDISRLNVSFEDRDYMYLEDNTMCKDNNGNFRKYSKFGEDYDKGVRRYGNGYTSNELAYKAYMSDNEGTSEFNRYRRSIPALPTSSSQHNFGYEHFRILSPEQKREAFTRNSYAQSCYEVRAGGASAGRQTHTHDFVDDLYAVPHTPHHHKVCSKLT